MRSPHWRWAGRGILVTRAIQQWSQRLPPRKWQRDEQEKRAEPALSNAGRLVIVRYQSGTFRPVSMILALVIWYPLDSNAPWATICQSIPSL